MIAVGGSSIGWVDLSNKGILVCDVLRRDERGGDVLRHIRLPCTLSLHVAIGALSPSSQRGIAVVQGGIIKYVEICVHAVPGSIRRQHLRLAGLAGRHMDMDGSREEVVPGLQPQSFRDHGGRQLLPLASSSEASFSSPW